MSVLFNFNFAYSDTMQILLIVTSCISTLLFGVFTTNILLLIYGETASLWRRALFVFLAGTLMNDLWIYGIYYMGGRQKFSPLVYNLVTIPNPVFAIFFFLLGVKILRLSPYRSIRLMANAYIFIMVIRIFQWMLSQFFFSQPGERYNYMIDAVALVLCTGLYALLYMGFRKYVRVSQFIIRLTDGTQTRPLWSEILILIAKSSTVYCFLVFYPIYANTNTDLYMPVMFIFLLFILGFNLLNDGIISSKMESANKAAHMKMLNNVVDGFSEMRHEFNNILQTYEGYIATENYEKLKEYHRSLFKFTVLLNESDLLNKKFAENPALIALIMQKQKAADARQINMQINITCNIENLYIHELDLCESVEHLLDNAIEASKESVKKWVSFSMEEKADGSKLIIISNSTRDAVDIARSSRQGATSKKGHLGMGLNHTRKILGKYPNASFLVSYYDHEFTAYINVSSNQAEKNIRAGALRSAGLFE